jgi:uncharacterized protein (TIGR02996 family)
MGVTEAELIAAIARAPADDAPRLVYADWLLERNDLRGEIIGLQIQHPRRLAQIAKLIAKLPRPTWVGRWPPPYERGFATRIAITNGLVLIANIAAIRAAHPFATIELADGAPLATSADGERIATVLREGEGGGVTLDNYGYTTTTTAVVIDLTGRELHRSVRTKSEWSSGSGDGESGERIVSVTFSADRVLVLGLDDGTTLTHEIP